MSYFTRLAWAHLWQIWKAPRLKSVEPPKHCRVLKACFNVGFSLTKVATFLMLACAIATQIVGGFSDAAILVALLFMVAMLIDSSGNLLLLQWGRGNDDLRDRLDQFVKDTDPALHSAYQEALDRAFEHDQDNAKLEVLHGEPEAVK